MNMTQERLQGYWKYSLVGALVIGGAIALWGGDTFARTPCPIGEPCPRPTHTPPSEPPEIPAKKLSSEELEELQRLHPQAIRQLQQEDPQAIEKLKRRDPKTLQRLQQLAPNSRQQLHRFTP